jgi:hypothetical protein
MPGTLYYQYGYEDHKYLLLDAIDAFVENHNPFETNAPNSVELFFDRCGENRYLFQALNLSGFNGVTVTKPIPIHGIRTIFPKIIPKRVFELCHDGIQECPKSDEILIDVLDQYRAFVLEC